MKPKKHLIGFYRKGYVEGYDDGYDDGISKGYLEGYQKGIKFKEQEEYYNASCRYGEQICPQCNSHFILRAEPMRFCYECGSRLSEVENDSIKKVTNAEEAKEHQINEDISKGFEEFTKIMFKQGQKVRDKNG